jgi:hypothetical protein
VAETHVFRRHASRAGMTGEEIVRLKNFLSENPEAGDVIKGTGGATKVRFPKLGRGKSGSYRVITYFTGDDIPVFLMDVYSKGETVNLSARDRASLKKELEAFADDYRAMISQRVQEMRQASEIAS